MSYRCRKHMARPVLGGCVDCEALRRQERRRVTWSLWVLFLLWRLMTWPFRVIDRLFQVVIGIFLLVSMWCVDAFEYLRGKTGYRVFVPAVVTLVGAYFGLYAVMEARHERRMNRAAFERSAFIDLVTSDKRGAVIAAMKNFGPIQSMKVPPEPKVWPPWQMPTWWWGKPSTPNLRPLGTWAQNFLPLCTPDLCGRPNTKDPEKGVRIDLTGANLTNANLIEIDLRDADLSGTHLINADLNGAFLRRANLRRSVLHDADLARADLRGAYLDSADLSGADLHSADLSHADLTKIKYDDRTRWPSGFTPPLPAVPRSNAFRRR